MEIFVDFGLFEVLALTGLAGLGRAIYRRPLSRSIWLALSAFAPGALLILSPDEVLRWIATLALATSLVNVAVLVRLAREGSLANWAIGDRKR